MQHGELSFEYSMWMNEVCMILTDRSIGECTDEVLGYHKVVGSELEVLNKSYFRKLFEKDSASKRSYYRADVADKEIVGCISSINYEHGEYDVVVFVVPPGRKRLKQVLCFRELRSPFAARLALGILFESFAQNDFNIEQFEDDELASTIQSMDDSGHIVGQYRTFDDKYRFAVTFNIIDNQAAYDTYYFKKVRGGYEMIGKDMDFPTLVSALGSLTQATDEIEYGPDDEDSF